MIIYKTNDEFIADLLFIYCEGKSFLWRMFYGWRETKKDVFTFIVSKRTIKVIVDWATTFRNRIEEKRKL